MRYRAPALEKGLELLELLSREPEPLSIQTIADRVGRSRSELFRVMKVLESQGYVVKTQRGDGYTLTDKLFSLGLGKAREPSLMEAALPRMREIAENLAQSCHLAVRSGCDMVVIARVEAAGDLGFAVRVGYRRALSETASGLVLLAFQPSSVQSRLIDELVPEHTRATLFERIKTIKAERGATERSRYVEGILDISAPIIVAEQAVATLTIPFVKRLQSKMTVTDAMRELQGSVIKISKLVAQ